MVSAITRIFLSLDECCQCTHHPTKGAYSGANKPLLLYIQPWLLSLAYILSHCQLAVFLIWLYVKLFSVDVSEAERGGDLGAYRSLGAFFSRRLRPGLRPVSPASESGLVSPADGTVTHRGPFAGGFLQQVKGVHYSINYVSSL